MTPLAACEPSLLPWLLDVSVRELTVVHVIVDDGDALQAEAGLGMHGSQGHVGQEAEAHATVRLSVVPAQPYTSKVMYMYKLAPLVVHKQTWATHFRCNGVDSQNSSDHTAASRRPQPMEVAVTLCLCGLR